MTPDFRTQNLPDPDPTLADRLRSYVSSYSPPMARVLLDIAAAMARKELMLDEIVADDLEQLQIAQAAAQRPLRGRNWVVILGDRE